MNNKILLGTAFVSACALAWAAKDPVIMTVNGVDVPQSEFEYLYHKNSQQQMEQQPISEYVKMFENYKLKVADAKAMGIDTLPSFIAEMKQYRKDLAAPYIADSVYLNKLVEEAYQRAQTEVPTSHIMLVKRGLSENANTRARLDSIRNVIVANNNFEEMARKYSEDRRSAMRDGSLGYITAGLYPYKFEEAAYALKPGEVSEIVESPVGYHLIKVGESRKARGEVLVSHILLLTPQGATPEQIKEVENKIDSIYSIAVSNPGEFARLAREFSDDPGSKTRGGKLDWFGTGRMVPEFEETSFTIKDGEISKPFKTSYGYHIIYKHDSRGIPSLAEMKPGLLNRIQHPQDERSQMISDRQRNVLAAKHKGQYNDKVLNQIRSEITQLGLDSTFYEKYASPSAASLQLAKIGKKSLTMGEFLPMMRKMNQHDGLLAVQVFNERFDKFMLNRLMETEEDWLEVNQPEYRNLLNEYRDGSLLYEASVRNVWDKASKDRQGLENFFETHRNDYNWNSPRVKGLLVQAKNDSVAGAIKTRALTLGADTLVNTLRKEFKGEVKIDRVLAPQGSNAMVDNIVFNGKETQPAVPGFTEYFLLNYKVIDAPEELGDVKAQVTGDYQLLLEEEWLKRLHEQYPIVVNNKVLDKIK